MSSKGHRMTVDSVRQEGGEMRHLIMEGGCPFTFGDGQYVSVGQPGEKPGYFAIAS